MADSLARPAVSRAASFSTFAGAGLTDAGVDPAADLVAGPGSAPNANVQLSAAAQANNKR